MYLDNSKELPDGVNQVSNFVRKCWILARIVETGKLMASQHAELLEHVNSRRRDLLSLQTDIPKLSKILNRRRVERNIFDKALSIYNSKDFMEYCERLQQTPEYEAAIQAIRSTSPGPRLASNPPTAEQAGQALAMDDSAEEISIYYSLHSRNSTDTMSTMSIPAPPYCLEQPSSPRLPSLPQFAIMHSGRDSGPLQPSIVLPERFTSILYGRERQV